MSAPKIESAVDAMFKGLRLIISGMHCDGCVRNVRGQLQGLIGAKEVDVAVNRADVWFDPDVCKTADLIAAIARAGNYQVTSFTPIALA